MSQLRGDAEEAETRRVGLSRWLTQWRHQRQDSQTLFILTVASIALAAAVVIFDTVPISVFVLPLVMSSFLIGPRELPWFTVFVLVLVTFTVPFDEHMSIRTVMQIVLIFVLGLIVLLGSFRRTRLGVAGSRGEQMFVDLRDRILARTGLPAIPEGWLAESELRSAGGTPFAGDFVIATRTEDRLSVAVVDVSGKGEDAATRALLLAGAFDGLLGALPPEEFLDAANAYLLRQEWEEGFATAVHFTVDFSTGDYELRSAGHPPAVHLSAGSGRWALSENQGPVLGLIDDYHYETITGHMGSGDAMLLYTDGLVETKSRDIMLGIDKMTGRAQRLLQDGFEGAARRLVEALGSPSDDRALILIHRR